MNTVLQICYDEPYSEVEALRCRDFIHSLSDHIRFEDDTWVCEKRIKSVSQNLNNVSIYFRQTPPQYKEMVKYYVLFRLMKGIGVKTVCSEAGYINSFLKFLRKEPIDDVTVMTALDFREYIDSKSYAESTRASIWTALNRFFCIINGYNGIILRNPFCENFYESHRRIDSKYIPEQTAKQLDRVFTDEHIPLHLRCIYWLLRLIPSRIGEILGMKIDCVKPFDGHFCIFIPSWKQNGGYREPLMRVIHVNDRDMGAYLLALIREQQKMALSYQDYMQEGKKNALFTYRRQIVLDGTVYYKNQYRAVSWEHVSYNLKKICREHNIRDENGIYCVTSHQFRHNGITDRLRAGFTLPQIAEMTGHHGTAMIYQSYTHLNLFPETLAQPRSYTAEKSGDTNPYLLFGGRILNMDSITESRLLCNLRAHRVPGGICADVTHCGSRMWSCPDCRYFVPEKEQLPFFEEQTAAWRDKAERFQNDKVLSDNFKDIAERFQRIAEKLKREGENTDE